MPTSYLQNGDSPRYKNEGHNEMVELVDKSSNNAASKKYIIKLLCNNKCFTTDIEEDSRKKAKTQTERHSK